MRRHGIGFQGFFYIIVTNPDGFVFRKKSQLKKYCAVWPIKTMGINPDEVFTSEIIPEGTKQLNVLFNNWLEQLKFNIHMKAEHTITA